MTLRESGRMHLPDQAPHQKGKILDHDAGIGEVDASEIERRARELAIIDGLEENQVNEGHRYQARQELMGTVDADAANDDAGAVGELISEDDTVGESGGAVSPATNAATNADEQSDAEELYAEGIAEAEHDRMVESRRQEKRDNS